MISQILIQKVTTYSTFLSSYKGYISGYKKYIFVIVALFVFFQKQKEQVPSHPDTLGMRRNLT